VPGGGALSGSPELDAAVAAAAREVRAERASVYVRRADRREGRVCAWWRAGPGVTPVPEELLGDWAAESDDLPELDPLFARALAGDPIGVVDDVETVAPDVANREHERGFGHRALLHVNLNGDGVLHGVLELAMTSGPRVWSAGDRAAALRWRDVVTPLAVRAAAA
jgi:GAF domain-containing protein